MLPLSAYNSYISKLWIHQNQQQYHNHELVMLVKWDTGYWKMTHNLEKPGNCEITTNSHERYHSECSGIGETPCE